MGAIVALAGVSAVPTAAAAGDCNIGLLADQVSIAILTYAGVAPTEKVEAASTLLNAVNDEIDLHGNCADPASQCMLDFHAAVYGEFRQADGAPFPIGVPSDFGVPQWALEIEDYAETLVFCLA